MLEAIAGIYYNIFGVVGGAWIGIISLFLVFIMFMMLFVMFIKIPKILLKTFILGQKSNKVLVKLIPYNIYVEGTIIDGCLHFSYGNIEYGMMLHQKKIYRMYGLKMVDVIVDEFGGMNNDLLIDLEHVKEEIPKDIFRLYLARLMQKDALEKELAIYGNDMPNEDKTKIQNTIEKLNEFITNVENTYKFKRIPIEGKKEYIQTINWENIKEYYISASLSQFHNMAKSYGIAVSKKMGIDVEKWGFFIFIALIAIGVLYMLINGNSGGAVEQATGTLVTTAANNITPIR